ncbi:MAG TPA: hypothetical protein VEY30_04880 [Myxococcaceae bacterium]|nr:hypothetical protein [Myxococcaceae bacterium]
MRAKLWLIGCIAVIGALGSAGGAPFLLDARLQRWDGSGVQLSAFRGKPTVVFYEDRNSTEINRRLKNELVSRGRLRGLMKAAHVVAVANLEAYDFFPARNFARRAVRDVESRAGIPVLIDWKKTLATSPWNLPPKNSSVVLLDPRGQRAFERSGHLSDEEVEEFFHVLDVLLGLAPQQSAKGGPR